MHALSRVVFFVTAMSSPAASPLLEPWPGAHGGLPPFDAVQVADFSPAITRAIDLKLAEVSAISQSTEKPTFKNTFAALEKTGQTLQRVETLYGIWAGSLSSPEVRALEEKIDPQLASAGDKIAQDVALFVKLDAVATSPELAALTAADQRLVQVVHGEFVKKGAKLDAAAKVKVAAINQRLASLYAKFRSNVLNAENNGTHLLSEAQIKGLPSDVRAAAASEAESKGQSGKFAILNTRSSVEPFLTYAEDRAARELIWRTFVGRGTEKETNNEALITEILQLRMERARLRGFPSHAHWNLTDTMAGKPERALELMEAVWKPAVARVHEEVADMQKLAAAGGQGITIEPWDYRFYAEKVRKEKYDLNEDQIKPYLQLDKLRDGMFWVAGELFGLTFVPVTGVPVFHPDVTVFSVERSGQHIGLFYFDPFARKGKRSGAWMSEYRGQRQLDAKVTPIVSNNCNFLPPTKGEAVLISWDDAVTLFHEFGHALHGLTSRVAWPTLAGTNVARDFVEFPSQLFEHWLSTPQVLQRFALHYQTGAPMPVELLDKIKKSATFNQGFATVEYLAAALIDMKLHLADPAGLDPFAFEAAELARLGMPKELVMRHRTPQFSHIFADDGYSAGYYSYLWSDTLVADAWEAFLESEGPFDKKLGARFLETVLSQGNAAAPAEAYRLFRGRDPEIKALMKKRGFAK